MDAANTEMLTVNRLALLEFFDEYHGSAKGDATGVIGVVGEDLNAACFRHYAESQKAKVKSWPGPVKGVGKKGPWLDCWIEVDWTDKGKILYQTEIKNSASRAIGGATLSATANREAIAKHKQERWPKYWHAKTRTLTWHGIDKVMTPGMKRPPGLEDRDSEPLLILWEPVGPKGADVHLFDVAVSQSRYPEFRRLWVFSVSSYLRSLTGETICLPMPNAARRIRALTSMFSTREAFVGFDSAWGGNTRGAISYAVFQGGALEKEGLPQLVTFPEAAQIVNALRRECDNVLVAIDQPTIVPNQNGSRPVDKVAGSLMGRLRSGTQSANRSKAVFGNAAPIWQFINDIGCPDMDFKAARIAARRIHLIEVYPALALPALQPAFMERRSAARYNPRGKKFCPADWKLVCKTVHSYANQAGLPQLAQWAESMAATDSPTKSDQDKIDAVICLLVGLRLRKPQRDGLSIAVIGDLESGYMVTPTSRETRDVLQAAADKRKVRISPE